MVVGYFDAEDFYGPLELYKKFEREDPKHLVRLVMGPWYHGSWSRTPDGRLLGKIDFGQDTSRWYRAHVQAPWFAHWLKGKGSLDLPRCWHSEPARIAGNATIPGRRRRAERKLYLRADGTLSFDAPSDAGAGAAAGTGAHDDYTSDPAKPVPYYPRPITDADWPEWEVADQRFVDGRPDVLTYESEPLKEDLTVSGDPVAHLFAATSGTDSDWVVKLIDVYPENYRARSEHERLSAHAGGRGLSRALPQQLREARAARCRRSRPPMRSSCGTGITPSRRATASWCKFRAPGFR